MPRRKPDASDFAAANGSTVGALIPADPMLISEADLATSADLERAERRTLAVILDDLVAYQETLEMVEGEDDRRSIEAQIAAKQAELIGKVDRYAAVIRRLEFEAAYEKSEAERHAKRRKRYEAALRFLEDYAIATMQNQNLRKLEGQGAALKLHQSPGQLLVLSECDVPDEYKSVTVTMGMEIWNVLIETDESLAKLMASQTVAVLKDKAKRAIKAGAEVPGVDLVFPDGLRVE